MNIKFLKLIILFFTCGLKSAEMANHIKELITYLNINNVKRAASTLRILEDNYDFNINDLSPLIFEAIRNNNYNLAYFLIRNHIDLNMVDNKTDKNTPLIFAAMSKNLYILAELIIFGGQQDKINEFGKTYLDYLDDEGKTKLYEILKDKTQFYELEALRRGKLESNPNNLRLIFHENELKYHRINISNFTLCLYCRCYVFKKHFRKHQQLHGRNRNNEILYICEYCRPQHCYFKKSNSLNKHIKEVHETLNQLALKYKRGELNVSEDSNNLPDADLKPLIFGFYTECAPFARRKSSGCSTSNMSSLSSDVTDIKNQSEALISSDDKKIRRIKGPEEMILPNGKIKNLSQIFWPDEFAFIKKNVLHIASLEYIQCPICKCYMNKAVFKRHTTVHRRPKRLDYPCKECEKKSIDWVFFNKQSLNSHLENMHDIGGITSGPRKPKKRRIEKDDTAIASETASSVSYSISKSSSSDQPATYSTSLPKFIPKAVLPKKAEDFSESSTSFLNPMGVTVSPKGTMIIGKAKQTTTPSLAKSDSPLPSSSKLDLKSTSPGLPLTPISRPSSALAASAFLVPIPSKSAGPTSTPMLHSTPTSIPTPALTSIPTQDLTPIPTPTLTPISNLTPRPTPSPIVSLPKFSSSAPSLNSGTIAMPIPIPIPILPASEIASSSTSSTFSSSAAIPEKSLPQIAQREKEDNVGSDYEEIKYLIPSSQELEEILKNFENGNLVYKVDEDTKYQKVGVAAENRTS